MKAFFDTSAFVKRYVEEPGSDRVQDLCAGADSLALSVLCFPEMISTLNRLVRERKITPTDYADLKTRMLADLEDVQVVNLTPEVVAQAVRFLEESPVRALDALHLGCAAEFAADLLVSADDRQLDAGRRAGLEVVDVRQ
jgi:predicted nucleic acid-binding protein